MNPTFLPFVVRTTDVGGGGGTPPASPGDAAHDLIDQAVAGGYRDSDVDEPEGAPETPPAGTPAPEGAPAPATPAAGDDDLDLDDLDFDNLSFRDGKRLSHKLETMKKRAQPWEETFGGLDEPARDAALGALKAPGILDFVTSAHPNDLLVLQQAYAKLAEGPDAAAAAFRAIADQIAPPVDGTGPQPAPAAGGASPAPDAADLDRPLTMREYQEREQQRASEAEQARQTEQIEREMLSEARTLGYDPDAKEGEEHSRFRELMMVAAIENKPLGDAHAFLEARKQAIIDGYVKDKKAHASRPAAPETGTTPSGAVPPAQVDPEAEANAILDHHLGPELTGRRS